MSKPLCIYHGNCADGFTAAWVVRKALGAADVDFHAGVYQDPPPDVTDRKVIIVDFSYKKPVLQKMAKKAQSILILDHHKSAAEDLDDLPLPPRDTDPSRMLALPDSGIFARFDMGKSGAQLAWDHFNVYTRPPALVDYVGDRDLWRFQMAASREVNAYVFAHDYTFENWDKLADLIATNARAAAERGGAIEQKHHKDVAELVRVTQRRMQIGGHSVPVANLPYTLTSDAGNIMAAGEPFAACYWDTPDGRVFSLRSTAEGLDVSAIAKAYGGGHERASGFRMPIGWEGDESPARA